MDPEYVNTESREITIFGVRAGGPYIIVIGAEQKQLSAASSQWRYAAHWTGTAWAPPKDANALTFDFKKFADEYVKENKELLTTAISNSRQS